MTCLLLRNRCGDSVRPDAATKHVGLTAGRQALSTLAGVVIGLAASWAQAQTSATAWLSVSMPHGGCSLTARQDGTASIHFGAMPRWVRVGTGTFNFEQLVRDLREKSSAQSASSPAGVPVGTVSLPANEDLLFIHDEAFVRSLLQRAWDSRVRSSAEREIEDYNGVAEACSLR